MFDNRETAYWRALAVRPRHEKAVVRELRLRGLEEYLPLYTARRSWSDRVKLVDLPLFPGYVFCRCGYTQRLAVLNVPGVISIVGFGSADAIVEDDEICAVQAIVDSGLRVEPWPYIKVGGAVRINHGALSGIEGTLVREKNGWRVVVNVELLRRSIAVEVDRAALSPAGHLARTNEAELSRAVA